MIFALVNLLAVGTLFAGMYAMHTWGRSLGERAWRRAPDAEHGGTAASEAAVYGLLGLFLAFTFSGAASRFDTRRDMVVTEANAIGTAWLRIDVLPEDHQAQIRDLFRRYLDARLDRYRLPDRQAADSAGDRALVLQSEIWSSSVAAVKASGVTNIYTVLLPSLNDMFDIVTTRDAELRKHPPPAVFAMLALLTLIGALFAGYGMARKVRSRVHILGFTGVMAMALFVIVDLEFPRLGLIRVDGSDVVLVELRESMN